MTKTSQQKRFIVTLDDLLRFASMGKTGKAKEVSAFEPYEPPKGVLPPRITGAKLAMDAGFSSGSYSDTIALQNINAAYDQGYAFPGFTVLSEWAQIPEFRRPAEVYAREITREWIDIQATGDEDKSDRVKRIEAEFLRLDVRSVLRRAIELDGFFGRAQIFLDLGDNDSGELRTELAATASKVSKGALKRLTVIEPIWSYPNVYNANDPLSPAYYKPESWFVMGRQIHSSRLLTIVSRQVPDIMKPAYAFAGLSLSQMIKPYVDNWLRTRQSVSDLVHAFTVWTLKTDLSTILQSNGAQTLYNRMQMFNLCRDNHGVNAVDKETEEFSNVSAPLGGLDHLQAQAQEHMAAPTGIPLVYLTGITPSGLNATSAGEIEVFQSTIGSQQEIYSHVVKKILHLVQLSLFGEIDDGITFTWRPLKVASAVELATLRKTQADTDQVYVDMGVLLPDEVRHRIADEEESPYSALDLSRDLPEPMMERGTPGPNEYGLSPEEQEPQAPDKLDAQDAGFEEADHPRDEDGKFGAGSGHSSSHAKKSAASSLTEAPKDRSKWPEHIKALKLPPAWTDVRISADSGSTLQAVGKDAKGRAQYVYSKEYQDSQAQKKFERTKALIAEFDGMAAQVQKDIQSSDPTVKTNADCMDLVMKMGLRPGSNTDTKAAKKAYGATTLEGRHVKIDAGEVSLSFTGKKGVELELPVMDDGLKRMLIERKKQSGEDGKLFSGADATTLLAYSHSLDGGAFKVKDFRTHVGTSTALNEISGMSAPASKKEYQRATKEVAKRVSKVLGNTPTVALQSYIDPVVFSAWRAGIENQAA